MNDKIQLAAMGDELRLTDEQAKRLAEMMPRTGALQVIDDEPMRMAKRIEELEGLLTEAAQYIHDYCEVTSSQGYGRGIRLLNCIRQQVYGPKPDAKP